jgi:hypothetical protein
LLLSSQFLWGPTLEGFGAALQNGILVSDYLLDGETPEDALRRVAELLGLADASISHEGGESMAAVPRGKLELWTSQGTGLKDVAEAAKAPAPDTSRRAQLERACGALGAVAVGAAAVLFGYMSLQARQWVFVADHFM